MRLASSELDGSVVRLTPVTRACLPALTRAALSHPAIWEHIPYRVASAADVEAMLERWLGLEAQGAALGFATCLCTTGEIIGGTSIMLVDEALPSVEIGATWIVPEYQRTRVNSEAKLLQLTHCFEVLHCERVEFKTDIRNLRSRAAIARIGAREEGTLRAHRRRLDGSLRDSVLFSIIACEWPGVRAALQRKLQA